MHSRIIFGFSITMAFCAAVALPWLAWQEAQREAHAVAADMTRAYASAVLHRADKTVGQADYAIRQLLTAGAEPCSPAALGLMRRLVLATTYIQAVGQVRDGAIVCSSMGNVRIPLGRRLPQGVSDAALYPHVPLAAPGASSLMAVERHGLVALVHRDLPLDISISIPGTALAVLHRETVTSSAPELARGSVIRAWLAALGARRELVFFDGERMVVLLRSERHRIVAVAAVPANYLEERAAEIAWRLLPLAALAGLLLALALLFLGREQRSIAAALRHGLRRDEFYLLYQPIVELGSGRCIGVEALLRWKRATDEQIGPDLFIPVAEESGLITRLTERVFELVERDAAPYLAAYPDFHVAINLSAADLESSALIDRVDGFLRRSGARASNLMVEITERGFLDLDNAVRVTAALRERGVELAIDDFGTGYSSLSYLESLDLDILKIDRSFIEAIGTTAATRQVVGHIIAMARTMGLHMIAEGVESEAQAAFLKMHGVEFAQGWLFGKPMPFAEAARLADGQRRALARQACAG